MAATWRWAKKLLWYTIVFSLPLTLFPIVFGGIGGGVFHFWSHRQGPENTHALLFEIEQHERLSYWNVPGAQTIHNFMDNKGPFHIQRLRTVDWLEKLYLGGTKSEEEALLSRIDEQASLDGLVRNVALHPRAPTESWIWITSFPEYSSDPWDAAFSRILQEAYLQPFPNSTSLHFIDCSRSQFLCGIWGVRRPTLIHMKIASISLAEDADADHDMSPGSGCSPSDLHSATFHVIEFPLVNSPSLETPFTIFPRNTLPTPDVQLRTIIRAHPDTTSWLLSTHFEPWFAGGQLMRRFNDHMWDLYTRPNPDPRALGHWLQKLNTVDEVYEDYILKPLFGDSVEDTILAPVQDYVFTFTILACELTRLPFTIAWETYAWYFGLGWNGEPLEGMGDWADGTGQQEGAATPRNMMDDMMAGFWDFVAQNMSSQALKDAQSAASEAAEAAVTEKV